MKYRRLGPSGLYVSELCLGTMTFGSSGQGNNSVFSGMGAQDVSAAAALVSRALDAGVNFFDTADIYRDGESEEILGAAIKASGVARDQVVIGTKCFGLMGSPDVGSRPKLNDSGLSRRHILKSVEGSLKRLGTDFIDIYQCHGFDPATPLEETMRTFHTVISSGKVRYVGCSNWPAWAVTEANGIARRENLEPLISVQAYYSLAGRDAERELVPMMRRHDLGMIVWSPLAGGYLSGKYQGGIAAAGGRRAQFNSPPVDIARGDRIVGVMRPMAEARGVSVSAIALAWLLHRDVVASVILGARHVGQLDDNFVATDITLSGEELAALHRASALAPEYPGWQIAYQKSRHLSWRHGAAPNSDVSVQSES